MRGRTQRRLRPNQQQLSEDQVEDLFSTLDETGHIAEDGRIASTVDPLNPDTSPAGINEKRINRRAMLVVIVAAVLIVGAQVAFSVFRRVSADSLADSVTVETVSTALRLGVEWGDGFTQFPEDYVVEEADEGTGRIEVTVTNTQSSDMLTCFASSQIQAAALSINALLNPNIYRVVYHVNVYVDTNGNIQSESALGLPSAEGELTSFITFIWTKETSDSGTSLSCTVSGMDEEMAEELRLQLGSSSSATEEDEEPQETASTS